MKPVWCIALLVAQILICNDVGSIQKDEFRGNVRRERRCLASRGIRRICPLTRVCRRYVTIESSSDMFKNCKRVSDSYMVCCSITRRWLFDRAMPSNGSGSLLMTPAPYIRNISSFISVRALSRLETSTSSAKPMFNTSASVRRKRSFNLVKSFFNASAKSETVSSTPEVSVSNTLSSYLKRPFPILETIGKIMSISRESITSFNPSLLSDFASAFPKPPVCGVSQGTFSRIVGGSNANLGNFPWLGLVAYRSSLGFDFKCGASLITSQHSLTAAHCIDGLELTLYSVRLGELDLADHTQTNPVDAVVKRMIKHEKFSMENGTNDIGLLVFYKRVVFTDLIRPICLPLSAELRSNKFVDYHPFVAGWGKTRYQGALATRLQMVQVPVVSEEKCREAFAPLKIFVIDERVICAGGVGGKDACNGDSGGPLMQPIWNSTNYTTYFYQTGIVSLGYKCGEPGIPGIYTRITEYIPWIQKHVLGKISG